MGLPKTILTEDEYLAFERAAQDRHIYVDGEAYERSKAVVKIESIKRRLKAADVYKRIKLPRRLKNEHQ